MEIRQLEYFRTIAAFQNLTKAADSLHITQPALSRILKRLEDDLGFELFVRRNSRIELSAAGEIFLTAVGSALDTLNDGIRECRELVGEAIRQVSVSVAYEGLTSIPTELFLKKHPALSIQQMLLPIDASQSRLVSHELDFSIAPELFSLPEIKWTRLITEEMLLIFPLGHPLSGKKYVNLREFQELSLVFNEAVYDRTSYNRVCAEYSLRPNILFQSNEHQMVSNYMSISREKCVLFVPISSYLNMLKEQEAGDVAQKPMPTRIDPPVFYRTIGVARTNSSKLTPMAKKYMEFLTDYFRDLEAQINALIERTFS